MMKKLSKLKQLTPTERDRLKTEAQVASLHADLKSARKKAEGYQRIAREFQASLEARLALSTGNSTVVKPRTRKRSTAETTAVALAGDWHCEEEVRGEAINGANHFTLEIADQRIEQFFLRLNKLCKLRRASTRLDTLVLALMGDFFSGYIHEELEETNALSPIEAVRWVRKRIDGGIRYLLAEGGFKKIIIPCVIGNHSRTTKRTRVSSARRNSYEWLMYHDLADRWSSEPRVEFLVPDAYFCRVELYGRVVRFHHGDNIRYQGGVGGISIPVNKAIAAWNKRDSAWLDCFGHWHQFRDWGNWICNGSLIGYNAYAESIKADFEQPSQTLFFVEKTLGVISTEKIYLS